LVGSGGGGEFKMKVKWILPLILCLVCPANLYSGEKPPEAGEEVSGVTWEREISLGCNASRGNTQSSQFSLNLLARRKRELRNEFTVKADAYYSSAEQETDAQKWYSLLRYGFNFGRRKKWDNSYRLEADHDRFANIDQRLIAAAGIAYCFYDLPGFKLKAEAALGSEHTDYGDETGDSSEAVLIPGVFFEKKLFSNSRITQDLLFYSTLEDLSKYRLHSETAFTNSITRKVSLRLSLINDYNSAPPQDTEENDLYFLSSLTYSF
jgi:putative salt-induced outer membrane protein YdiY